MQDLESQKITVKDLILIGAIVVQTGGFFYWAGSLNSTVQAHEKRLDRIEGVPTKISSNDGG